jgi:hypothetical protein
MISCAAFEKGEVFAVSRWLRDVVRRRGGPEPILLSSGIDYGDHYHEEGCPIRESKCWSLLGMREMERFP